MDSLKDALGLGDPYHIGVAVRDLVEAMPRFQELLGLGPWGRIDAEVPAVFRGAETVSGVRSAFADVRGAGRADRRGLPRQDVPG